MSSNPIGSGPVHWSNGQWIPHSSACIYATNSGLLTGLGVFETLAFSDGHPICFSRHYARLESGASQLALDTPDPQLLRKAIADCVAANGLGDARVRITLTYDSSSQDSQSLLISAEPLIVPQGAATLISVPYQRNPTSPLSGIKSTSYAESILALRHAQSLGADEALLCDTSGNLSETATANLFFVHSGKVYTPPLSTGCLPGTIRALVLELFEQNGVVTVAEPTPPRFVEETSEAFLTSSIRHIHPISKIDSRLLPKSPGPVTREAIRWLKGRLASDPDA